MKIAVITDGFETRPSELRGDVFGGDVESAGRSVAAFERIRRDE